VPHRIGLSQNALPSILFFEQPGVAVNNSVGRSELHEEALSLFTEFITYPNILQNLRSRFMPVQEDLS
jgi:hypothetical protein